MEYDWKTDEYIRLVENTNNPFLRDFIDKELDYLCSIDNLSEKAIVDVGSGYGRVVPILAPKAKSFYAVELDKNMLRELKKTVKDYKNCLVIECDAQELQSSLKLVEIEKPIVMSLQNSLGTPYGDPYKIIDEVANFAKEKHGEVIISLFTQESLKDEGVSIYASLEGLVGKIDLEKTNFEKGDFITRTGYKSHWFSCGEREEIKNLIGGKTINEIMGNCL
ncbi:rRNA adenine N-6-methyltransferase family protein [bacterium]|nr:rRNA adenine N-6-methyltransferase family protein [bacterium]